MSEDWAAVATAITNRLRELGWRQRQLAERSQVSQAIVRELQHHTLERRRSPRTMTALSQALHWHPDHLHAVLHGRTPPDPDLATDAATTLWSRLDTVDERLNRITTQLDSLTSDVWKIINHLEGISGSQPSCPRGNRVPEMPVITQHAETDAKRTAMTRRHVDPSGRRVHRALVHVGCLGPA